jgi:hypothetical protein
MFKHTGTYTGSGSSWKVFHINPVKPEGALPVWKKDPGPAPISDYSTVHGLGFKPEMIIIKRH